MNCPSCGFDQLPENSRFCSKCGKELPLTAPVLDFSDRIRDLTQVFVGREWLLREVDDFMAQAQDRYLVITGEPGIGKSAVAARLTQVRDIHAFHLCQARRGGTLDPIEFVRSLSHQLVRSLPDFGRHVVEQQPLHIDVRINVGQLQSGKIYGVYINEFVVQTKSADEAFQYLVREPLKAWAANRPPNGPVLLLVDALDEALRLDRHPNIVDLIDTARDLPDAVRWVLTSRPGEHLGVLPGARIVMLDDSAENMADVRAYVDAVLGESQVAATLRSQGVDAVALRDELVRRSAGNFLYLHYVLNGIRQDVTAERPVAAPEQLPVGLNGVYREFLDRVLVRKPKDEWCQVYRPVLGMLAVAQDALDFDQLVTLSDVKPQGVNDVVTELGQFLDVAPGETKTDYRIYHTSFADFLTDRTRNQVYWTDPEQHHRQIASHYTQNYADCWPDCDLYGLRYLPAHLFEAEQTEALRGLFFDFDWLQAKLEATDAAALLADYELLPGDEELRLVQGAIRLSAHVLIRDKTQLPEQLLGRLLSFDRPEIQSLLEQVGRCKAVPWLRPLVSSLTSPGGSLLRTLTGHTRGGFAVAVTPDGRRAVSGSYDNTLKVWDLERGEEQRTLTGHMSAVRAVAVTPDGRRAISASDDSTLKVWDLERGEEQRTLTGHTNNVNAVAVTPDGRRAVSASMDATLKVWDLERGEELCTLTGHTSWVRAVAVTPDGRRAVSASRDETLKVWDLERGEELCTLTGHTNNVNAVATTPDGRRAVSGSSDRTLKVWDLERGEEQRTLTGHTYAVNAVAVTPDGRRAVSGSHDRTLKVWDLERGEEQCTLTGHTNNVNAVATTPDGRWAVSASYDNTLKVWDLERGEEQRTLTGHASGVTAVAVTPDGRRAVSASWDRTLKVWDLERGEEQRTLTGHTYSVSAVAVTPDGRRAVSAASKTLKVWDLERGEELCTLTGHTSWVNAVAVTPDGRRAVSASDDRMLKVWDLERGEELCTLTGHMGWVRAVAVTPDGRRAVSGSSDRTLKVWDLERGEDQRTLTGHTHNVNAVAVTPDGRRAISASHDRTLKVWDLELGKELRTLSGHTDEVRAVAVTSDGRRAVSASPDGTLKVWDIERGKLVSTFHGDSALYACSVALDDTIVAGGASGRVHFLRLEGV